MRKLSQSLAVSMAPDEAALDETIARTYHQPAHTVTHPSSPTRAPAAALQSLQPPPSPHMQMPLGGQVGHSAARDGPRVIYRCISRSCRGVRGGGATTSTLPDDLRPRPGFTLPETLVVVV